MQELFPKAVVVKRNVLNELRSNNMTVQELRFFAIYMSKINPEDITTRLVRFPIEDFRKIMGFGRLNISQLQTSTDSLLCKVVHVPDEDGRGMRAFQLFKECHIFRDDNEEWFVEIDAHDRALPLMFDFRKNFFQYELWNALRLKSANQVRMYEVLKQWLNKKLSFTKEFKVTELRELLYIAPEEYGGRTGWTDFKRFVLDSCQEALKQHTDICYTYERGKVGRGGKWLTIVFHISKNTEYDGQMTLDEWLMSKERQDDSVSDPLPLDTLGEDGEFVGQMTFDTLPNEQEQGYGSLELDRYAEVCEHTFAATDLMMIETAIKAHKDAPSTVEGRAEWLRECFGKLVVEESSKARKDKKISDRAKYLVKIIQKSTPPAPKQEHSYDLGKWHEMAESLDLGSISFGDNDIKGVKS